MNMRLMTCALAGCLAIAQPAQAVPDEEQPESSIVVVKKKAPTTNEPKKKKKQPPKMATPPRRPPPPVVPSRSATPAPTPTPKRPPPPAPPVAVSEPAAPLPGGKVEEPKKRSIAPLIGIGVSTALGVAGAVFAAKAVSAVNEDTVIIIDPGSGGAVELPPEFEEREKRVLTNGLAATILLSAATSGLLASIISLTD